ncbi:Uridine nucleosidase 1 [Thelohanellus kitauei]|uniref:Uridine nucleosidase 1 n=1 Tax=Thelohanellus kitauei TaxID=669202 RepID=A0A0C2M3K4_THEKT|nr:Uridine nucleosidase 1 [Thelohanellus kitauei]
MKVIVDTDVGIDDALSITFLSACKDVEIVAITLVPGNAQMEGVASIFWVFKIIIIGRLIESDGYFGPNALGEIELPKQEVSVNRDMSSVEALIHYSKKYPKQIHGVFIGPLTNLALAFLIDNEFPSRLASINIMGGDRSDKTLKNATEFAEFNAWCDPPAFVILKECISKINIPITIVDWETCWTTHLPFSLVESIKNLNLQKSKKNKHIDFFDIFYDKTNKYIQRSYYESGILATDLYVAVGLINRSIFKTIKKVNITNVDISGERIGHVDFEEHPNGSLDLVYEVDTELMAKLIFNTIAGVDQY